MRIEVLFFGQLKDMIGLARDELEVEEGASLETVFRHYASQSPKLEAMASSIAMARNERFAPPNEALKDGDEVAMMPPVSGGSQWLASGGSEGVFAAVTERPIDSRALAERAQTDGNGAVLVFEGVVRDNSGGRRTLYLDYECYMPLALRQLGEIGRGIRARFDIHAIALVHRIGRLQIREASVSIVVAAAHRRPAYEASLEAIDEVKRKVPVWKKEYFADGEVWVEGQWDESVPRTVAEAAH
jgi:molybdopterin synthase catalytic subunit